MRQQQGGEGGAFTYNGSVRSTLLPIPAALQTRLQSRPLYHVSVRCDAPSSGALCCGIAYSFLAWSLKTPACTLLAETAEDRKVLAGDTLL